MKRLLLMRHAKASPSNADVADFDRPLIDEGRLAARRIGEFLKSEEVRVDVALSSPAARAGETIEAVLMAAGISIDVRYDRRLYEGGRTQVLEVLFEIKDDVSVVLMVGHNPGMEELVELLTGQHTHLSPGTLATITLEANEWRGIIEAKGAQDNLARPKELP